MTRAGRGCRRHESQLSAFVDQTLPEASRERLLDHLVGCPSCTNEVAELTRLRQRLVSQRDGAAASPDLSKRLLTIAERSDARLWLSSTAPERLPSRRRFRARALGGVCVTLVALAAGVGCLSMLIAPNPKLVTSPDALGRRDFSIALTALSINDGLGAVLLAAEQGAEFAPSEPPTPRPLPEGAAQPISTAEAMARLHALAEGDRPHTGRQRLVLLLGGHHQSATVEVERRSGSGSTLAVLGQGDQALLTGRVPLIEREAPATTDLDFALYPNGSDTIAGQPASVLEARRDDRLVARWWIDGSQTVALRTENYDSSGRLTAVLGFEAIDFADESHLASVTDPLLGQVSVTPFDADADRRCGEIRECPLELAGLPLVARSSSGDSDAMTTLVYSDGVTTTTVSSRPGYLAPNGALASDYSYSRPGMPEVRAWQSGRSVIVVTSNGSRPQLWAAISALPHDVPVSPDVGARLNDGLTRLLGGVLG